MLISRRMKACASCLSILALSVLIGAEDMLELKNITNQLQGIPTVLTVVKKKKEESLVDVLKKGHDYQQSGITELDLISDAAADVASKIAQIRNRASQLGLQVSDDLTAGQDVLSLKVIGRYGGDSTLAPLVVEPGLVEAASSLNLVGSTAKVDQLKVPSGGWSADNSDSKLTTVPWLVWAPSSIPGSPSTLPGAPSPVLVAPASIPVAPLPPTLTPLTPSWTSTSTLSPQRPPLSQSWSPLSPSWNPAHSWSPAPSWTPNSIRKPSPLWTPAPYPPRTVYSVWSPANGASDWKAKAGDQASWGRRGSQGPNWSLDAQPVILTRINNGFEEREYPETLFICGNIQGGVKDKEDMMVQVDRIINQLDAYLTGQNQDGKKLSLNRPIFGRWEDNRARLTADKVDEQLWFSLDMCYWITQKKGESVPKPLPDSGIFLSEMPVSTFYARTFSGPGGEEQGEAWSREAEELRRDLNRAGFKFDESKIYSASYSPPFAKTNRRDEVMFKKMD